MSDSDPVQELMQNVGELVEAGHVDEALSVCDQAIEQDANFAYAWYAKGCLLGQFLENPQEAAECFLKATQAAPDSPTPWYNLAITLQDLGEVDESLRCFDVCIRLDPENSDAWFNKGAILDGQHKHKLAIECYDEALKHSPDDVDAWAKRGDSFRDLGLHDEALESYEQALERDPNNLMALSGTGEILCLEDEHEEALGYLEDCVDLYPGHAPAWCQLAIVHSRQGDQESALDAIEVSLEIDQTAEQWSNKGEILSQMDRWEESIQCFDQSMFMTDDYPPAKYGKARSLMKLERFAEAKPLWEQLLTLENAPSQLLETAEKMLQKCRENEG